jgi:predicted HAD superfamily phosphohydrolase YqeG
MLDLAYYNSLFVLNEKAEDDYKKMINKITGTEIKVNTLTNKKKLRFRMISERLGLKYPESWKNIE